MIIIRNKNWIIELGVNDVKYSYIFFSVIGFYVGWCGVLCKECGRFWDLVYVI